MLNLKKIFVVQNKHYLLLLLWRNIKNEKKTEEKNLKTSDHRFCKETRI